MWTWWVSRSSSAPVSRSEPKTSVHSSKGKLVVARMEPRSYTPLAGIPEVWLILPEASATGVYQPPPQLRGVRIYRHGCKQGCFQPPRPLGVARAGVPYPAKMPQGGWYGRTVLAMYSLSRYEDYEPPPYLTRRRGVPSGRYAARPRLRARGLSRRTARQGQSRLRLNWSSRLPGTHPLNWFSLIPSHSRLERPPSSAGISPLNLVVV